MRKMFLLFLVMLVSVGIVSGGSNIFMIFEAPASCTDSNSDGFYDLNCTGRYGQGVNWSDVSAQNMENFLNIDVANMCPGTRLLFSGSDSWYNVMETGAKGAIFQTFLELADESNCKFLGRVKGQSGHDAMLTGSTTTALVVDSANSNLELNFSGSTINMTNVIDVSLNDTVNPIPFVVNDTNTTTTGYWEVNIGELDVPIVVTQDVGVNGLPPSVVYASNNRACKNATCSNRQYNNNTGLASYSVASPNSMKIKQVWSCHPFFLYECPAGNQQGSSATGWSDIGRTGMCSDSGVRLSNQYVMNSIYEKCIYPTEPQSPVFEILMSGSNAWFDTNNAVILSLMAEYGGGSSYPDIIFLGRVRGTDGHSALLSGGNANSLIIERPDGTGRVNWANKNINMSELLDIDLSTTTVINTSEDVFELSSTQIKVQGNALKNNEGNVTIDDTNTVVPPVIKVNGNTCPSNVCQAIQFNHTSKRMKYKATNFSTHTLSSSSNIFALYEPPASCTSDSGGFYYGCTGRYGQAMEWSEMSVQGMENFLFVDVAGLCPDTSLLFSGSDSWYTDIETGARGAVFQTFLAYASELNCKILGKIKGQTHHDALMDGTSTTSLVIDSEFGTITYEASSTVDMSQVLDMTTDTLVNGDPFLVVSGLIGVDSANFGTLNKPANIKFKNVPNSNMNILKDGVDCPTNVCTNTVYDSGADTLSTDVTGFSNFTLGGYSATYQSEDFAPVVFDAVGTALVALVGFVALLVIGGLVIAYRRYR